MSRSGFAPREYRCELRVRTARKPSRQTASQSSTIESEPKKVKKTHDRETPELRRKPRYELPALVSELFQDRRGERIKLESLVVSFFEVSRCCIDRTRRPLFQRTKKERECLALLDRQQSLASHVSLSPVVSVVGSKTKCATHTVSNLSRRPSFDGTPGVLLRGLASLHRSNKASLIPTKKERECLALLDQEQENEKASERANLRG